MTLRLTDAAEDDLAETWAYLTLEASEPVAARFLSAIHDTFNQLLPFPMMGASRELFAQGLRVIFHGTYAIYYTFNTDELVIIRVLHGSRDVAAIIEHGGSATENL